jgi:hypothetical protein
MFRNKFSVSNLFKLLLISTIIYQLIDLTIKYRQYKTIIKSDLKYFESGDLPSMTLCRNDHDWRFENKLRMLENEWIKYQFVYNNANLVSTNDDKIKQWNITIHIDNPLG